jgi:hypothetical protein
MSQPWWNVFGAMMCRVDGAEALGVASFRPAPVSLLDTQENPDADRYIRAGFQILQTVRNASGSNPSVAPQGPEGQGLADYWRQLQDLLDNLGPENVEYLVIENEASLPDETDFSDYPRQYGTMLETAVDAGHSRGVKVANDGTLSILVRSAVYQDFVDKGKLDKAADYALRTHVDTEEAPDQAATCRKWLNQAKASGVDAVNVHMYYLGDSWTVTKTVEWVNLYTGLPVISNELGTYPGSDEAQIVDTGNGIVGSGVRSLVLYAQGGDHSQKLVNLDGTLTAAGEDWAAFIEEEPASP